MTDRFPTLETARLILRGFRHDDASEVQRLAGEREIAATTENVPHPYEPGMAEEWIRGHQEAFEKAEHVTFAITLRETGELIGAMTLKLKPAYERAELGYWIGKPYWGEGYATEAARAARDYGFGTLSLQRMHACYLAHNEASGRVMQKIGMQQEGVQRQHIKKWGGFFDTVTCGMLRSEWRATRR